MGGVRPQVFVEMSNGEQIVLPFDGPSRKTLIAGGIAIAILCLGVGIAAGARAFRAHNAPALALAPPLVVHETNVVLSETPYILPFRAVDADGGAANFGTLPSGRGRPGSIANLGVVAQSASGTSRQPGNLGSVRGIPVANPNARPNGAANQPLNGRDPAVATNANSEVNAALANIARNANNANNGSAANAAGASADPPLEIGSGSEPDLGGIRGPRGPVVGGYSEGDTTDATGTMSDPTAFTFVYRFHRAQIGACHESVTRSGQSVVGRIRVRMRLGTNGHVVRTTILENTTRNAPLAQCVQDRIRSWAYPAPEGGEVDFEYNLAFGS